MISKEYVDCEPAMCEHVLSLNGVWLMNYQEERYLGATDPWQGGDTVTSAVPGYWEDMTEQFRSTGFFSQLRINPEFCVQRYPMSTTAPDMLLPNFIGNFFYHRDFIWRKSDAPVCIYFGGVQNAVSVWINGVYLGRHEGYSTPFSMDIPENALIDGKNEITLSVSNHRLEGFDGQDVSGITSRAACECVGGIWGDIELRTYLSPLRDVYVLISDDCSKANVYVESIAPCNCSWSLLDGNKILKSGEIDGDFSFDTTDLAMWSPESPKLYTLRVICGAGCIERVFAVRRLVPVDVHLMLNGKPYYLRGVCEHCYYPMTVNPSRDIDFYRDVIKKLKELGFNYVRFHTHIPDEAYMQAADELGMILQVESPNNGTLEEWQHIVRHCRKHPSVLIYCCGNELLLHDEFLEHLSECAEVVHQSTDALFSPMSALRGLEYSFVHEPEKLQEVVAEPKHHNPRRFAIAGKYSDLYNSYTSGQNSYHSLKCDPAMVDSWSDIYQKPRLSHEICIDGTYTDLSLKDRYKGTRIGNTELFTSVEKHLAEMGVLHNAPIYFRNSCQWQRRVRKYCFECVRMSQKLAGYDFLGPIDTHWHTFGYDVGMMNEFYELKPGETVRGVRMYNSPTVILSDLGLDVNFICGQRISVGLFASHYGDTHLSKAKLDVKLLQNGEVRLQKSYMAEPVANGTVGKLTDITFTLPESDSPKAYMLSVTLTCGNVLAENQWELYAFPKLPEVSGGDLVISDGMAEAELIRLLKAGSDVLFLGGSPFNSNKTSFQIALAGRTSGNLATVIYDHPVTREIPHEGFCSWQFRQLLEDGHAVCFNDNNLPFEPIIEVVSTHKFVVKQAALFEFRAYSGRVLVCGFHFSDKDPCAVWLKNSLIAYARSDDFSPKTYLDEQQLQVLIHSQQVQIESNTNLAVNMNDKTAIRKKKSK